MSDEKPTISEQWEEFIEGVKDNDSPDTLLSSIVEVMKVAYYYGAVRTLQTSIHIADSMPEKEWVEYVLSIVGEGKDFISKL